MDIKWPQKILELKFLLPYPLRYVPIDRVVKKDLGTLATPTLHANHFHKHLFCG